MTSRSRETQSGAGSEWSDRPADRARQTDDQTVGGEEASDSGTLEEDYDGLQPADTPPLPLDAVFEILKNERRRIVLTYLMDHPGEVKLGDLAEHVAIEENDISPGALTSTERKRAYVGLYQCHLPKMDELGAVEFNRDRELIELGPNVDQLEPYFDAPTEPDPWPTYYLALAAANGALFVGVLVADVLMAGAMAGPGSVAVGSLAVLSFAGLSFVHHRRRTDDDESDDGA